MGGFLLACELSLFFLYNLVIMTSTNQLPLADLLVLAHYHGFPPHSPPQTKKKNKSFIIGMFMAPKTNGVVCELGRCCRNFQTLDN